MLAEQEERFAAQEAATAQRFEQLLAEERNQRAADRLEAEVQVLDNYRAQVVAAAVSSKSVAPQLIDFIQGTSKDEIDASAALAVQKTNEILAEVAGRRSHPASCSVGRIPYRTGSGPASRLRMARPSGPTSHGR
jgi:hypothetical protein